MRHKDTRLRTHVHEPSFSHWATIFLDAWNYCSLITNFVFHCLHFPQTKSRIRHWRRSLQGQHWSCTKGAFSKLFQLLIGQFDLANTTNENAYRIIQRNSGTFTCFMLQSACSWVLACLLHIFISIFSLLKCLTDIFAIEHLVLDWRHAMLVS